MSTNASRNQLRVGLGTDLHRLEKGRPLFLAGVELPSDRGAVAHSDGDVVLHAVADALLGSLALGDIGLLFPDSDPAYRGLASSEIVQEALARVVAAGGAVVNVDVAIDLERPKILPHRDRLRSSLASLLAIPIERCFLKAKTGEGLGPIGEGRAIAAQAVVLVSLSGQT